MGKTLNKTEKGLKLHLGCGEKYMEGYVNIDYPASEQTVQCITADKYIDIVKLEYPENSIEEIRLHHVFEHFSRPISLALLCRWHNWLKPGGLLRIETPDAKACCKEIWAPWISYSKKQQIMRHLFGSQEAFWAVHMDGWYKNKFVKTLTSLGFENLKFKKNKWGPLKSIEVFARKSKVEFSFQDYLKVVRGLLTESTIRTNFYKNIPEGSELAILEVWLGIWEKTYFNKEE